MADYPQYPADEAPEPVPDQHPGGSRPRSIVWAVNLIWVALGLTVLSNLLAFGDLDTAVDAALEADTTGELTEDTARSGVIAFAVGFMVLAVLIYTTLALFIRRGARWARLVFTVLAALFLLLGLLGLSGDQSALARVLGVAQLAVTAATLYYLWQKESTAWFERRG